MWECKDMNKPNISTCRLFLDFTPAYVPNNYACISRYVYISHGIYLAIFWCKIHQTLPKIKHKSKRILGVIKNLVPDFIPFFVTAYMRKWQTVYNNNYTQKNLKLL